MTLRHVAMLLVVIGAASCRRSEATERAAPATSLVVGPSPTEAARRTCEITPLPVKDLPLARTTSSRAKASVTELSRMDDETFVKEIRRRILQKMLAAGSRRLSRAEWAVYLLDMMDFEVRDGGFERYFRNMSGDCALEARDALDALGSPDLVGIYARARAVFPDGRPDPDQATRIAQMERIPKDELRALDPLAKEALDLTRILAPYLHGHVAELDLPAE